MDTHTSDLLKKVEDNGTLRIEIARLLGLNPSAVTSLFAGTRALKYEEAVKLQELINDQDGNSVTEVPVIGMAGAGNWVEAVEETGRAVPVPPEMRGKFAVEVKGDSMDQLLPDGSLALINPEEVQLFVGKTYLLLNEYGEATIKRYRSDPARFEPVSSNPAHKAFDIGSHRFSVVGRVTGSIQEL